MRLKLSLAAVAIALLVVGMHVAAPFGCAGRVEAGTEAKPAAKPTDTWPETNAGKMAKGWVEAFSAGEPAMRKFLAGAMTTESLTKKPMDERMETYRTNREKFGKLSFGSVVSSKPSELAMKLIDEDGKQQEFIFVVQDKAPFKLLSVSMKQNAFGAHFGGGFHH